MRRIAYVFGGLAAAGAGTYTVVYLYRWQWQRATLCGVLLLVVEVMLLGIVLLGRLTRIEERLRHENDNEATSVLVQVDTRGAGMTGERRALAAEQVWERCRDSTSVPLRHAALGDLGGGMFAGVVRPALTEHDRMRLRGCLEDITLDRTHLTVVGIGDADADDD
ncbi:hypothetical protein [Streptomyces sp. GbtcB6]|uniref:hypothetical protein n=1 Tax=Streptomyces sp. GbtcB6 TaxID=2824751 RepID=UPI001C2F1D92|nr:hypothetical protein [Streptomyces sp. GbtcB6]